MSQDEITIVEYRGRGEMAAATVIGALIKARPALEAFADAMQTAAEVCRARGRLGGPLPVDAARDLLADAAREAVEAHAAAHSALLGLLEHSAAMSNRELTEATTPTARQVELPLQEHAP